LDARLDRAQYEEVQEMSGYGSMGSEGQAGMDRTKSEITEKAGDVMDQAREQTGQVVDKARGSAFQMMDQQKGRAADGLGGVAHALHQTGDNLQGADQGALGQYAHRAADTVDQISQQLRNKSVDQLLSEAENFARREPEVFLGGAVLLGLLASRFLKASNRQPLMRDQGYGNPGYQSQYGQSGYGRTGMGPGGYDRGAWSGEGIDYRSTGTGGYRTTISGGTGSEDFDTLGGTLTSREIGTQRQTGAMGNNIEDASWTDEDRLPGSGAGSSQA
jgi:hypothetical protein